MKLNAEKIDILLAERDMTKAKLAEASGIARQNLSTIVRRGTCLPTTAAKLARGLGVPLESILEREA